MRYQRVILAALSAVVAILVQGCAATPPPAPVDPLQERIFSAADGRELDREALIARLAEADVVYLGETHDNPRHQAIQHEVLAALIARGKAPALGLEMVGREQTGYVAHFVAGRTPEMETKSRSADIGHLRRRLGWDGEAETRWARYGPLLELARSARLTAFGLDLEPALRLRLQRAGRDALTPVEAALLPPTAAREPAYRELMFDRLKGAHCGYGTAEGTARLYATWVARNDAMAAAIVAAGSDADRRPVVVIVGAGHVQHARGVISRVAQLWPGADQVDVGVREVAPEPLPLADYLASTSFAGTDFGPTHTYLWLTVRHDREDPCARYREILEKRHGKPEQETRSKT